MTFKNYHIPKVALGVISLFAILLILFPKVPSNHLAFKTYNLQFAATLVLALCFLLDLILHSIEYAQNKLIIKDNLFITLGKQGPVSKLLNIIWTLFVAYTILSSIENRFAASIIAMITVLKIPQNFIWIPLDWELAISHNCIFVNQSKFLEFSFSEIKNLTFNEDKTHVTLRAKNETFHFKFKKREIEPYIEVLNSINSQFTTTAAESEKTKSNLYEWHKT